MTESIISSVDSDLHARVPKGIPLLVVLGAYPTITAILYVVGNDHVRLVVRGEDGTSFKAIAFRAATTDMGQALLHAGTSRRLWLVGRARIDDWSSRPQAELHVEDAAFAD